MEKINELLSEFDENRLMPEDFNTYDYCAGNIDDAYSMGYDHGYHAALKELKDIVDEQRTEE